MVTTILARQVYPKRAQPSVLDESLYPPWVHLPALVRTVVGMDSTVAMGPAAITLMTWNLAVHRSMEPDPYRANPSSEF